MAPTLDRHVVTAVLVAHDGARWLPEALKALLTQSRPVQRLVTVDTGSADRGPAVLAEVVGEDAVLTLPRTTGYGEAIAEALRQDAATAPVPEDESAPAHHADQAQGARKPRTEWIWLLHDDCAPDREALDRLLRTADADPNVAVLGPKVRDWDDRRVLRELGVTVDAAGRRHTGLDRREFDQGQHDGVRDVLSVGSAGMLVRRDVWERLGGFDVEYGIFRDDLDFCWRVHAAGYRVVTASDAVVYHAEASRRGLRGIGMTAEHPARRDRRNALLTLLANQPLGAMARTLVRNVWASLAHALVLVATKRPGMAREELRALGDVLRSPGRLRRARAARAEGRTRARRSVRRFLTRWVVLRRAGEAVSEYFAAHEREREDRDDDLTADEPGPIRRFLARPGVLLALGLTAVAAAAERSLPTAAGRLGGGALVPAWGGASDLWAQYLSGWHPVGLGTDAGSPPYVGVLAVLSTAAFGKPWLAVSFLLLGSVPLAGLAAYRASRLLVVEAPRTGRRARASGRRVPVSAVRAWFAAVYALLPAATGAVAGGRIGTCAVLVLLPLIAVHAARFYGFPRSRAAGLDARTRRKRAGRAAWAVALLLAVAMSFVPLIWPTALLAAGMVWALLDRPGRQGRRGLAIALGVPPLLTLPWTAGLLLHPSRFLTEAGLHRRFAPAAPADLLALDPGGPGTPARWALAGLLAVAVCALPLRGRRGHVLAGWLLAVFGLLVAVLSSAATVTKGADEAPVWPGLALLFAGAGVLLAATAAVQRATEVLAGSHLIYKAGGAAVLVAALTAPVLAAAFWVAGGAGGPLGRVDPDTVPQFVQGTGGVRTLVLHREPTGRVSYTVLRGTRPHLGEAEVTVKGRADDRMDDLVAGLAAGREGDDGPALTRMGVQYLLVPHPAQDPLTKVLDASPELTRLSRTGTFAVWRLQATSARMMLLQGSTVTPLPAGRVNARVRIPPGTGPRTLLLAEPADGGWRAALNGHDLKARTVDGWAQGYVIPTTGGEFELARSMTTRHIWVVIQGVAVLLVAVLALPGAQTDTLTLAGERERRRGRRGRRRAPRARVQRALPPAATAEPPESSAALEHARETGTGEPSPEEVS
ncbi:GT2 family glycosyltransferase [Actinomadura coerulea]|uniref:GT2 family glycosyltransferase n=1 Tax=Actinomadura coerulea TaxID=46159 RepID=A0A7X0G1R9_9ACTN|nr:glycosyltransferase family 2 protein [Actinomadura coerulea]MBB6397619.1 GT2 family glycosyltransferase [Actinomadura coerulea]GGQ03839.1 integral membrane regulatory protein [Actinomadura coerulea]